MIYVIYGTRFFLKTSKSSFLGFCLEAMAMASSPPVFHRWAFTERLALLASNSLGSEHLAEVVGMGWAKMYQMECVSGADNGILAKTKKGATNIQK